MKQFIETEDGKRLINNFIDACNDYKKWHTPKEQSLIEEQKTRFYKCWCYIVYGHLMVNGTCLRCGKTEQKQL